ncbi:MAG TPA: DegV family protein [Acidimicrobiales bacterium]|nr:DegV family protein [Acidimicrobiales bacterium]
MPVVVIADSAAALEPEMSEQLGVVTVPMQLEIGGRPIVDEAVSLDELVARLDDGVQTSGPSPGAFAQALEANQSPDGTVVLTVGQRLSSTYQSASSAASLVTDPSKVRVVDTGTAAGAEGLVVIAAAQAARSGATLDEVEAKAREVSERVRLVAAVEQLTYLVRGGRVPAVAARAGNLLGVRPLFEMSQSHIRPLRPAFSSDGALDQILAQWRKSRPNGAPLHVAALHALRQEDAEALLAKVSAEVEPVTAFVGTFGPVMVAHTGPGVIGLAWWWG